MLLYTGMKVTLGSSFDAEDCKEIAKATLEDKKDLKLAAKYLAENYLSLWNENDKENVIMLCIALCAIDGEISAKEVKWLKELVAAATI